MKARNCQTGLIENAVTCYHCEPDGCKWEYRNIYECDGTPDNSPWTSIGTDGIRKTSPGVYNDLEDISSLDSRDNNQTSVATSVTPDEANKLPEVEQDGYCLAKGTKKAKNCKTGATEDAVTCFHCESGGCKWEWRNKYECDGTPDNSAWTSIVTDGILETSPGVYNEHDDISSQDSIESNETSVDNSVKPEDQVEHYKRCSKCHFVRSQHSNVCYNGKKWVFQG